MHDAASCSVWLSCAVLLCKKFLKENFTEAVQYDTVAVPALFTAARLFFVNQKNLIHVGPTTCRWVRSSFQAAAVAAREAFALMFIVAAGLR